MEESSYLLSWPPLAPYHRAKLMAREDIVKRCEGPPQSSGSDWTLFLWPQVCWPYGHSLCCCFLPKIILFWFLIWSRKTCGWVSLCMLYSLLILFHFFNRINNLNFGQERLMMPFFFRCVPDCRNAVISFWGNFLWWCNFISTTCTVWYRLFW